MSLLVVFIKTETQKHEKCSISVVFPKVIQGSVTIPHVGKKGEEYNPKPVSLQNHAVDKGM